MKRDKRPHEKWLRCTKVIARNYQSAAVESPSQQPIDFSALTYQIQQYRRRYELAQRKDWQSARSQARNDYLRQLNDFRNRLAAEINQVEVAAKAEYRATFGEIFSDLIELQRMFSLVSYSPKENLLTAVTDAIEIEGLNLGPFCISLCLKSLSQSRAAYYEVIAAEPNLPASNDDVTHPHVQHNQLCEGEADRPIAMALKQGRILDFFQIVTRVLSNYNPSSAYETIERWEDFASCGLCGHQTDSCDLSECANCETNSCDECRGVCDDCGDGLCDRCVWACEGCVEDVCSNCASECETCGMKLCSKCLTNPRCDDCEKSKEKEEEEDSIPRDALPAVHANGVGEAAVPA